MCRIVLEMLVYHIQVFDELRVIPKIRPNQLTKRRLSLTTRPFDHHSFFLRHLLVCCSLSLARWHSIRHIESRVGNEDHRGLVIVVGRLVFFLQIPDVGNMGILQIFRCPL